MNVPFYSLDYVNRTLGDALRESFSDVLDSKWFIRGSRCAAFEEAFAAYCGKKACVGVGNGLDALTLMGTESRHLRAGYFAIGGSLL